MMLDKRDIIPCTLSSVAITGEGMVMIMMMMITREGMMMIDRLLLKPTYPDIYFL